MSVIKNLAGEQVAMYRPNLLINGDFQCNQRGASRYATGVESYSLDMWRRFSSAISVNNNSITVDTTGNSGNGVLGQKVDSIEVGKEYTVCINVTSLSGSISIGTRAEFDKVEHGNTLQRGINIFTFTATGQWLTVCLKPNNSVAIEYIDLFEGSIAYSHVKEDYAIALMRSQQYLRIDYISLPVARGFTCWYGYPKKMNDRPTLKFEDVKYGTYSSDVKTAFTDNANAGIENPIANKYAIQFIQSYIDKIVSLRCIATSSCEPQ